MRQRLDEAEKTYTRIRGMIEKNAARASGQAEQYCHAMMGLANIAIVPQSVGPGGGDLPEGDRDGREIPRQGAPGPRGLLYGTADLLYRKAQYVDAEPLLRQALAILEKAYGENNVELVRTLATLGHVLYMRTDYLAAEKIYRRALDLEEAAHGKDKPGSIEIVIALGDSSYCRMEFEEAEPHYKRALATAEKETGKTAPPPGTPWPLRPAPPPDGPQREADVLEARVKTIGREAQDL